VSSSPPAFENDRSANAGWIAGALVIVAIMATGAVLWFKYHP